MDVIKLHINSLYCGYKGTQITYAPKSVINYELNKPELIAIIGKNGTGKSTLLRTIAALQKPIEGNIYLNNKSIYNYSTKERAKYLSYLPTNNLKIPYIKVYEYVSLGKTYHSNLANQKEHISDILTRLNLSDKEDFYLNQLSDGEMQRVAIAKVLFQNSSIMLLDEPMSHLDPLQQLNLLNILLDYVVNNNKTIIFSTHLTNIVLNYAHRIWLITEDDFIVKIPEQIIIDKDLEKNELIIEAENNILQNSKTKHTIRIIGDGLVYKYTKQAFLRYGISATCKPDTKFSVIIQLNKNDTYSWLLKKDNIILREFNSLEEIINFLNLNL